MRARNVILPITISHRPVLEQYHDHVLNVLKDGKVGTLGEEREEK